MDDAREICDEVESDQRARLQLCCEHDMRLVNFIMKKGKASREGVEYSSLVSASQVFIDGLARVKGYSTLNNPWLAPTRARANGKQPCKVHGDDDDDDDDDDDGDGVAPPDAAGRRGAPVRGARRGGDERATDDAARAAADAGREVASLPDGAARLQGGRGRQAQEARPAETVQTVGREGGGRFHGVADPYRRSREDG